MQSHKIYKKACPQYSCRYRLLIPNHETLFKPAVNFGIDYRYKVIRYIKKHAHDFHLDIEYRYLIMRLQMQSQILVFVCSSRLHMSFH